MSSEEMKLLLAVLASGAAAIGWFLRRWVAQVDEQLKAMHASNHDLKTRWAVNEERFAHLMGAIDVLREACSSTTKDVGALTGAVQRMFSVLEAKGMVEGRYSDGVLSRAKG